ncbi:hypothetical protein CQ14_41215 [Bradyrhizobium lablabi]|uniref:DUF1835 domain-containing protein n=1 Tax=Bradyrhizobium lablabi TaxID=722472 RepID=A0A0R3MCY8_9BRAD|nr:DUF3658 domain-containing protein [Bradyrhizobium lablabi]KRR17738.1 hypothetical protein CQ14_41215 [Bradyrhizobium lablabi]
MAASTLHIVFNSSAAAGLRDALRQAGRDERVVGLSDCLSFGPINPPDPELRRRWVEDELGYTGWEEVVGEATSFWSEALSISSRRVAWLSGRSTQEYAGFLEWLWRLGEEPVEVVDLSDVMVAGNGTGPTKPHPAISLAMLPPHTILENELFDRTETLTAVLRARYRELWGRLRTENAPLRVLSEGELVSAPLSFFDPLLLSCATSEWQKAARVVGEALSDFWETSVFQTDDLVLCARVRALAGAGGLEFRGNLSDIQNSELRLPISRARHD